MWRSYLRNLDDVREIIVVRDVTTVQVSDVLREVAAQFSVLAAVPVGVFSPVGFADRQGDSVEFCKITAVIATIDPDRSRGKR